MRRVETVADLIPGREVEGVYACVRKDRLTARTGSPYLALELRDRTGSVPARVFRDPDFLSGQFERGDLVWVAGRVERFRDELQLDVRAIRKAEPQDADPADFLPVAYRDLDELDGFFEHLAREVHDRDYARLLGAFVADGGFRDAFRRAPCSRAGHHAYLGGLLEHTVAVATLAHELCLIHPGLNPDLLLTGALIHDIGKVREFELGADISLSDEGRLVGHLVLGERMVAERITRLGDFPEPKALALSHCLLAHHGADALPGRRFGSIEAVALFRLNSLDSAVKRALEHGLAS
ncbi:MAG: 3'-5' exoribonuclease YhaM family protein [Thermoleophilaceae bacterium]